MDTPQPDPNWSPDPTKTALNRMGKLAAVIMEALRLTLLVAIFLSLTGLVAVDAIPLGVSFDSLALVLSIGGAMAIVAGLTITLHKLQNVSAAVDRCLLLKLRKTTTQRLITYCLAGILAALAAVAVVYAIQEALVRADAARASRDITVIHSTSINDADHALDIRATLAEFERARRRLLKVWPAHHRDGQITVQLFSTAAEYQKFMGRDDVFGSARCHAHGSTIAVPLEDGAKWYEEKEVSTIPMHEMVHAEMCRILGPGAYHSIPRWFHEGLAELHSNRGAKHKMSRALNRMYVRLNKEKLPLPRQFCMLSPHIVDESGRWFYRASWEFIRTLESHHGKDALDRVLSRAKNGTPFNDNLVTEVGGPCSSLYRVWLKSF